MRQANENAKKWLGRYQENLLREKVLLAELEQLRARAEQLTRLLTGMPGGQGSRNDVFSRSIEDIIETEKALARQVAQSQKVRAEIEHAVSALRDSRARELMRLHYVCGKTFEQAAGAMGISTRWAYALHREALGEIEICDSIKSVSKS